MPFPAGGRWRRRPASKSPAPSCNSWRPMLPCFNRPGLGDCAELACVWEARARKAGNVNPEHAFADLTVDEFYRSAVAIAPIIEAADQRPVGATVRLAIEATREVGASTTNLGIVLLLAPLAAR